MFEAISYSILSAVSYLYIILLCTELSDTQSDLHSLIHARSASIAHLLVDSTPVAELRDQGPLVAVDSFQSRRNSNLLQ